MPRQPNVPTVSQLGDRLDLEIRQGSTLGPFTHQINNPDGSPMNLTGCTVQGQVRTAPRAYGVPVGDFLIMMPVDPTVGWYEFSMADEITATMPMTEDITRFYWDMELIDSLGRVIPLMYGEMRVQAEVTREDTDAPVVTDCICTGD